MIQVRIAQTSQEREAIYRFRYQVYAEEMRKKFILENFSDGLLVDDLDESAILFYGIVDDEIIATLRLNILGHSTLPIETQQEFGISQFTSVFPDTELSFSSRMMVAPKLRNSSAAGAIVSEAYRFVRSQGIQFDFMRCAPWLVPFYDNLGYRRYTNNVVDNSAGLSIPLVLVIEDIAHLKPARSPFYRLARHTDNRSDVGAWFAKMFLIQSQFFNTSIHTSDQVWEYWLQKLEGRSIHSIPLFQNLNENAIKVLLKSSVFHSFKAGETILRVGDIGNAVFLVLSGQVEVSHATPIASDLTPTEPYDCFGEATLFTQLPSSEQATALTDVELLVIPVPVIQKVMKTAPDAMCQLFLNMSRSICQKYVLNTSSSEVTCHST